MSYTVKDPGGDFTPAPQGTHRAVGVDVVDVGMIESKFGARQMVRLVWEIDEQMEDGKRFVVSQLYTPSLHKKAKLRHHLEAWRGREFNEEERRGFELENIIGKPCQLQVVHNTKPDGDTYANVAAVMAMGKGMESLISSGDYVRVKDRPDAEHRVAPGDEIDDDAVPF